jgi:putative endonuclease
MSASADLGKKGEDFAAGFLKENGFRILARNWRYGKYEVDIIAEDRETIVFAEVKTRADNPLDPPSNAITREKQKAMIWTAEAYVKRYRIDKDSRFDVIIVLQKGDGFEVNHIPYAFYPSLR